MHPFFTPGKNLFFMGLRKDALETSVHVNWVKLCMYLQQALEI